MNIFDNVNIIGLTGQSGSGKSTVSDFLRKENFAVIDADEVSRSVAKNNKFLKEVMACYPDCVADSDLDRKKLAGIVFNNPSELEKYTSLIYPYITFEVFKLIRSYKTSGHKIIILDAPTLFESGLNDICNSIISVVAPFEVKVKRLLERDGIPCEMVYSRINAQNSESFFESRSDYLIVNDSTIEELECKVKSLVNKIGEKYNV